MAISLTVGLIGDVMLGSRVARALSRVRPEELWAPEVRDLAGQCDFVVANLECSVSSRGDPTRRNPERQEFFQAPPKAIGALEAVRTSAVGLANDHALDYEEEALLDTLRHLEAAGIAAAGAGRGSHEARRGVVIARDTRRLGLVAASDHPVSYAALDSAPGIAYLRRAGDTPRWLVEEIARLRAQCDRVVAFLHWGPIMRGSPKPWQQGMAADLQAAGADLVAGHSAHVFHGIGWTKRGPILFDLGDALHDHPRVNRRLRSDLGLFARWRPVDPAGELEVIGLRVEQGFTRLATGADADWISARLERSSRPLAAEIARMEESVFRIHPGARSVESVRQAVRPRPQPKERAGSRPVLWTAEEVIEITGGKPMGPTANWEATDVSYQPHTVRPGDLFAATHPPYLDGHKAVPRAFTKGAVAALVRRVPDGLSEDAPLVLVDGVKAALGRLAEVARDRSEAKPIAVTGSVGKTSLTLALKHVLAAEAPTYACRTNENDSQGAAVSVARMPGRVKYAVFELSLVGRRLDMTGVARKSRLVRPQVAVITAIRRAHVSFYDTVENIADAKAGILEGLREGGVAVLPRDDPLFERLETRARRYGIERIVTFGTHAAADVRLDDLNITRRGSEVFATLHGRELEYELRVFGRHQALNSLAVLAAVDAIGANPDLAVASLSELTEAGGRGRRHSVARPGGAVEVLDHSFSGSSTRAAIEILGTIPIAEDGRRVAVLGELVASAGAERLYVELALELLARNIDLVYTAGEAMLALREVLPAERLGAHAESSRELAPAVVAGVRAGDTVLVKGSGPMRMRRVVSALLRSDRGQDQTV